MIVIRNKARLVAKGFIAGRACITFIGIFLLSPHMRV